jgi:chromosomal replication initiator protein
LPTPSIKQIQSAVSREFGVTAEQMLSRRRFKILTQARAMSIYLCRVHTGKSFLAIARAHQRENHSTAINAVQRHHTLSRAPEYLKRQADVVRQILGQRNPGLD